MRIDFDSAWKDALETYFAPFLMVAAPELAPLMGDHEAPVFLEQELQELARALGDEPHPENTDESVAAAAETRLGAGQGNEQGAEQRAKPGNGQQTEQPDEPWMETAVEGTPSATAGPADPHRADPGADPGPDPTSTAPPPRRRVDKLVRLPVARGMESQVPDIGRPTSGPRPNHWLLHVEVQVQRDPHLASRLFDYHCLIARRHRCWVATVAVLADLSPSWRPRSFSSDAPPLGLHFGFRTLKLIDLEPELESPKFAGHPIAMVARAHLAILRLRHDPERLYAERWRLTRRLYEEGFARPDVLTLYRLIDRLMILPHSLMVRFRQELFALEKDKNMPYVDTISRMCREEGLMEGLQSGLLTGRQEGALIRARESVIEALEVRFGEVPFSLRERIIGLDDLSALKTELRRAITVPNLDQF